VDLRTAHATDRTSRVPAYLGISTGMFPAEEVVVPGVVSRFLPFVNPLAVVPCWHACRTPAEVLWEERIALRTRLRAQEIIFPAMLIRSLQPLDTALPSNCTRAAPAELIRRVVRNAEIVITPLVRVRSFKNLRTTHASNFTSAAPSHSRALRAVLPTEEIIVPGMAPRFRPFGNLQAVVTCTWARRTPFEVERPNGRPFKNSRTCTQEIIFPAMRIGLLQPLDTTLPSNCTTAAPAELIRRVVRNAEIVITPRVRVGAFQNLRTTHARNFTRTLPLNARFRHAPLPA